MNDLDGLTLHVVILQITDLPLFIDDHFDREHTATGRHQLLEVAVNVAPDVIFDAIVLLETVDLGFGVTGYGDTNENCALCF